MKTGRTPHESSYTAGHPRDDRPRKAHQNACGACAQRTTGELCGVRFKVRIRPRRVLRRTAIVVVVVGPSALAVGLAFVSQSRSPARNEPMSSSSPSPPPPDSVPLSLLRSPSVGTRARGQPLYHRFGAAASSAATAAAPDMPAYSLPRCSRSPGGIGRPRASGSEIFRVMSANCVSRCMRIAALGCRHIAFGTLVSREGSRRE